MSNLEFEHEKENEQEQTYGTQLETTEPEQPEIPEFDNVDDDIDVPEEDGADGQLNLFGDDVTPTAKKPEPKKSAPKKPAPAEKVSTEFTVHYAGHTIPVPEDEMELDRLRQFLEMDFPELSKERTEMLLDKEKKQVVPVVKGSKKG